jgi:hypothetical protein
VKLPFIGGLRATSPAPAPLLARTARPRPVRHVRGGFVLPGLRDANIRQQAQQQLQRAALAELGARGISITNDHGSDLAGRFDDYCLRQFVEAQVRQRIGQEGIR